MAVFKLYTCPCGYRKHTPGTCKHCHISLIPSKSWYISFTHRAKLHIISTGCEKRTAARDALAQIRVNIREKKWFQSTPEITWIEARKRMETYGRVNVSPRAHERYECSLRSLTPHFNDYLIHQIGSRQIEEYKSKRIEVDKVRPATLNRDLAALRRMLNLCREWKLLDQVPKIRMLKEDNRRDRSLSDEQISKLLRSCKGTIRLSIIIALDTGLRKGSIFSLKKSDINFEKQIITTKKTKGGKLAIKPMTERVQQALKTHIENCPYEYLFFNPRTGKPFRVDASKGFQSACKRAGMKKWRFQDLKHVFVNRLFDTGADSVTVRDLADHASLTTTNLYASSRADQRKKAIEQLNK